MKLFINLFFLVPISFVQAEENKAGLPSVSFDPFPLKTTRTTVWSAIGTPPGKADRDTPFPNDFPPCVTVGLEDTRPYPAYMKGGRYFSPGRNILRVYRITDVKTAPYKTIQPQIEQLQTLLKARPTMVPSGQKRGKEYDTYEQLPDYPPRNSGHLIQMKMQYLDAPWGSGLFYIVQFSQGPGNAPNNEGLTYLFQGLSNDGRIYISADFRITHPKLPRGIDSIKGGSAEAEIATQRAETFLPKQSDDSFSPSLRKLREWVSTLKIK